MKGKKKFRIQSLQLERAKGREERTDCFAADCSKISETSILIVLESS